MRMSALTHYPMIDSTELVMGFFLALNSYHVVIVYQLNAFKTQ